ncbi:MAG: LysR family transcriptional regulator [Candidatus Sumerlaeia bacterium]|nr:LysR family transcriptional regulator [Candidatus Sumerlaeia bacterium]
MAIDTLGLTFRDLEYIIAVEEHRHFGNAADACHVSQPALSAQVRKVEVLLGFEIFVRNRRGVMLTPEGEQVVEQCRTILSQAGELLRIGKETDPPLSGPFRLGVIATLGPYLLPHILRPLRRAFPRLELLIKEGLTADLLVDIRAGALDAVLLSEPIHGVGITTRPLFNEPFHLAVPAGHPLWDRETVTMAEVRKAGQLLLLEDGHCLRDQAMEVCPARTKAPHAQFQATSMETLRHMVASGAGVTLIPALAVGGDRRLAGMVRYIPIAPKPPGRIVSLAWRATLTRMADNDALTGLILKNLPDKVVAAP